MCEISIRYVKSNYYLTQVSVIRSVFWVFFVFLFFFFFFFFFFFGGGGGGGGGLNYLRAHIHLWFRHVHLETKDWLPTAYFICLVFSVCYILAKFSFSCLLLIWPFTLEDTYACVLCLHLTCLCNGDALQLQTMALSSLEMLDVI